MLKLDFIMPKSKKGSRKAKKRDRSPSPAVSEHSNASNDLVIADVDEVPEIAEVLPPTKDTPIPPTQPEDVVTKKPLKNTSVILSDEDEVRVVEWLADHPLM